MAKRRVINLIFSLLYSSTIWDRAHPRRPGKRVFKTESQANLVLLKHRTKVRKIFQKILTRRIYSILYSPRKRTTSFQRPYNVYNVVRISKQHRVRTGLYRVITIIITSKSVLFLYPLFLFTANFAFKFVYVQILLNDKSSVLFYTFKSFFFFFFFFQIFPHTFFGFFFFFGLLIAWPWSTQNSERRCGKSSKGHTDFKHELLFAAVKKYLLWKKQRYVKQKLTKCIMVLFSTKKKLFLIKILKYNYFLVYVFSQERK